MTRQKLHNKNFCIRLISLVVVETFLATSLFPHSALALEKFDLLRQRAAKEGIAGEIQEKLTKDGGQKKTPRRQLEHDAEQDPLPLIQRVKRHILSAIVRRSKYHDTLEALDIEGEDPYQDAINRLSQALEKLNMAENVATNIEPRIAQLKETLSLTDKGVDLWTKSFRRDALLKLDAALTVAREVDPSIGLVEPIPSEGQLVLDEERQELVYREPIDINGEMEYMVWLLQQFDPEWWKQVTTHQLPLTRRLKSFLDEVKTRSTEKALSEEKKIARLRSLIELYQFDEADLALMEQVFATVKVKGKFQPHKQHPKARDGASRRTQKELRDWQREAERALRLWHKSRQPALFDRHFNDRELWEKLDAAFAQRRRTDPQRARMSLIKRIGAGVQHTAFYVRDLNTGKKHIMLVHNPDPVKVLQTMTPEEIRQWEEHHVRIHWKLPGMNHHRPHPSLTSLYSIDEIDQIPYVLMDYFEGEMMEETTAKKALEASKGPVAWTLMTVPLQLSSALVYLNAHEIYPDLRGRNLIVGDGQRLRFIDIGDGLPSKERATEQMKAAALDLIGYLLDPSYVKWWDVWKAKMESGQLEGALTELYGEEHAALVNRLAPILRRMLAEPDQNPYPSAQALFLDLAHVASESLGLSTETSTSLQGIMKNLFAEDRLRRAGGTWSVLMLKGGELGGLDPLIKREIIEKLSQDFEVFEGSIVHITMAQALQRWDAPILKFLDQLRGHIKDELLDEGKELVRKQDAKGFEKWLDRIHHMRIPHEAYHKVDLLLDYVLRDSQQLFLRRKVSREEALAHYGLGHDQMREFLKGQDPFTVDEQDLVKELVGKTLNPHPNTLRGSILVPELQPEGQLAWVVREMTRGGLSDTEVIQTVNGIHTPNSQELANEFLAMTPVDLSLFIWKGLHWLAQEQSSKDGSSRVSSLALLLETFRQTEDPSDGLLAQIEAKEEERGLRDPSDKFRIMVRGEFVEIYPYRVPVAPEKNSLSLHEGLEALAQVVSEKQKALDRPLRLHLTGRPSVGKTELARFLATQGLGKIRPDEIKVFHLDEFPHLIEAHLVASGQKILSPQTKLILLDSIVDPPIDPDLTVFLETDEKIRWEQMSRQEAEVFWAFAASARRDAIRYRHFGVDQYRKEADLIIKIEDPRTVEASRDGGAHTAKPSPIRIHEPVLLKGSI